MFRYELTCSHCNYSEECAIHALIAHRLECGIEITSGSYLVWCHQCAGPRMAELLPDVEEIEHSIAKLLVPEIDEETRSDAEFLLIPAEEHRANLVKEYQAKLEWLRQRTLPPHCLDCGSTYLMDMSSWTGEQSCFEHPRCGGQLRLTAIAHAIQGQYRMFSSEGLELFPDAEDGGDDS